MAEVRAGKAKGTIKLKLNRTTGASQPPKAGGNLQINFAEMELEPHLNKKSLITLPKLRLKKPDAERDRTPQYLSLYAKPSAHEKIMMNRTFNAGSPMRDTKTGKFQDYKDCLDNSGDPHHATQTTLSFPKTSGIQKGQY